MHPLLKLTEGKEVGETEEDPEDVKESKKLSIVAFTFPCGKNIDWDPEFGAGPQLTSGGSMNMVPTMLVSSVAALLTLLF